MERILIVLEPLEIEVSTLADQNDIIVKSEGHIKVGVLMSFHIFFCLCFLKPFINVVGLLKTF